MKYEQIQIKSDRKQICEDYFVIDNDVTFAVLDGATPLTDFKDEEGRNGAVLASRIVGEALRNNEDKEIEEIVDTANSLILSEMSKNGIKLENKHENWNTYLAMVRIVGEKIEFGQIGDCMIFAVTCFGKVEALTKDMVFGISDRAREERNKMRKQGFPIQSEDFYSVKANSLIFNRYLSNKDNGYAVLNGDPNANKYLNVGRLDRKEYKQILLVSDGVFPKDRDWDKMIYDINRVGLIKYVSDLVEYEESNNLYQDDKTAILIHLN